MDCFIGGGVTESGRFAAQKALEQIHAPDPGDNDDGGGGE